MTAHVPHDHLEQFCTDLQLHPTMESVVEHHMLKLKAGGSPIDVNKAVHIGPDASKCSTDDASGLDAGTNA